MLRLLRMLCLGLRAAFLVCRLDELRTFGSWTVVLNCCVLPAASGKICTANGRRSNELGQLLQYILVGQAPSRFYGSGC